MNKNLFNTANQRLTPATNTVNEAGGKAYQFTDEHALAQYALTGCFNSTYYLSAETQLEKLIELANKVSPQFLAQVAVYARQTGFMKDAPAVLLAVLSSRDLLLTKLVFPLVCDNAKMVKVFVQVLRSGATGRKSMGTALKRLVQNWLQTQTPEQLFRASVGNNPSLADIIKMVHPHPGTKTRSALYKYLIGKELTAADRRLLPEVVRNYEALKKDPDSGASLEGIPFQMLTNLKLSKAQYQRLAEEMSFSQLRQNLNSLQRQDVFSNQKTVKALAETLSDREAVRESKAMPFQLMASYLATKGNVPEQISKALERALDAALKNVPELSGNIYVAVDVSGSMGDPITGDRGTATTAVRCVDAAALLAAALLRKNPDNVTVMAFNSEVVEFLPVGGRTYTTGHDPVRFYPDAPLLENAEKLQDLLGGGTRTAAPVEYLNRKNAAVDTLIFISDNESWIQDSSWNRGTETLVAWNQLRRRNPKAKLVCVDIRPNDSTQAPDRQDILNIGGFSDLIFPVIEKFLNESLTAENLTATIKKLQLVPATVQQESRRN